MLTTIVIAGALGAGIGSILGRTGQCSTGACPLMANWKRGALFGGLIGLAFGLMATRNGSSTQAQETPHVQSIAEAQFNAQVIESDRPVVVDFYAPWCGPCKVLSPRLDKLASTRTNEIKFVKINVDQAQALAGQFNVQAIPTLVFFREGKVIDTLVGLVAEDELARKLDALSRTP